MATIRNLSEDHLYNRLPAGVLSLDEKGILQAVLGGVQDRYEDIRAHAKGLQRLLEPGALPQTANNAVLIDLTSPQGKAYTRSLDIDDTTPASEGASLTAWAAAELGLEADALSNVRFGVDPLRLIEAPVLEHLAATIGCILYSSSALTSAEQIQAREDLVATWFPRLKIKGTPKSFEALGRILGFEDIRFTPLYSRLSPREPADVGASANDPDFAAAPELWPGQVVGPLYDPHKTDGGPFFSWAGTASSGTSASDFYTQSINRFNPWIEAVVLDVIHGTVTHPQSGSYALGSSGTQSEGGPHKKAYVDPSGSTVRFRAIAEGESFNGLEVHVIDLDDAGRKVIRIDDRLSAIQYRSSYFDLGAAISFERAGEIFGDQAMRANPDLAADPELVSDGMAASPYRPWTSGSVAVEQTHRDWIVQSGTVTGVTIARAQAAGSSRQENIEALVQAGAQVTAAMEEVRPATRHLRKASVGYASSGSVPYAAYNGQSVLFVTDSGTSVYSESLLEGLAHYWKLDEFSGTRADSAGNVPLIDGGAASAGKGVINAALEGAGDDGSLLYSGSDDTRLPDDDFTITGWVWLDVMDSQDFITRRRASNSQQYSFGYSSAASNFHFRAYFSVSGLRSSVEHGALPQVDRWYFFRAWYNKGQQINLIINEDPATYDSTVLTPGDQLDQGNTVTDGKTFVIGADATLGLPHLCGKVDEVAIWNRTLTDRESGRVYNNGLALTHPFSNRLPGSTVDRITVSGAAPQTLTGEITQDGGTICFKGVGVTGSYILASDYYRFVFEAPSAGTVTAHWRPVTTEIVRAEPDALMKSAGTIPYQIRPEDDLDDDLINGVYDEYPWRRDLVGGGELIELDAYTGTNEAGRNLVAEGMALPDHTGAEYTLYGYQSSGSSRLRLLATPRDTGDDYAPAQIAIAFSGNFHNLAALTADQTELLVNPHDPANLRTEFSVSDLDRVFEAGYNLYHAGLVQGVPVADLPGFFGTHHSRGLCVWLPFNEHPADDLSVRNAASGLATQFLLNVSPSDRSFDPVHGPCLALRAGGIVESVDRSLPVETDYTVSFWVSPGPVLGSSGSAAFLRFGPLSMDIGYGDNALDVYIAGTSGDRQVLGSVALHSSDFTFVHAEVAADHAVYGSASFSGTVSSSSQAILSRPFTQDDSLWIGACRDIRVRDLRIWNNVKTPAELARIKQHVPTPTAALYVPSWFNSGGGDRYGLRALPTGWLEPASLPPWMRAPKLARIRRYDSLGRYEGESRFKETGLGGGAPLPATWHLGQQCHDLTAEGEIVYSGTHGALPGVNQSWLDVTSPGTYLILNTGVTGTGTVASSVNSGTTSPWPNLMAQTNPLREFIWVEGDDGYMHEVTLRSSGSLAELVAEALPLFEQPTGAQVLLESAGTHLAVGTGGTVYQGQFSGTDTTPPLYMYLNTRIVEDATDAWDRWTERGTASLFGNSQDPPVAALDENGTLEFDNTASLPAGNYRLTVESGNIGRPDADFDGFDVEIRIDTLILQKRLLRGLTGYNVRGFDVFEFALPAVTGAWILSVEWNGAFADESAGTARRLAIHSYRLERLVTEAWQVAIAPTGSAPLLTRLTTESFAGTTPGGWLAAINSYGSVVSYRHESQVYPANDTLSVRSPLSDLLTASTEAKTEDVLFIGAAVLADSGSYVLI